MVNLTLEQLKKIAITNHPNVQQKIVDLGTNYQELVTDKNSNPRIDIALKSLELKKEELSILNSVNIFYYQYLALHTTYKIYEKEKDERSCIREKVLKLLQRGYRSPIDLVAANSELTQVESILENLKQLKTSCLKRLSLVVGIPELEIDQLDEEAMRFFEEPPPPLIDTPEEELEELEEIVKKIYQNNSDITVAQLLIARAQNMINNTSLQNNPLLSSVNDIAQSKENISNLNYQIFELPKTEISLQDRVTVLFSRYKNAAISYKESMEILSYQRKIYKKLLARYSRESNQVDIPSFVELRLALEKYLSIYLQRIDALLICRNIYELFTILSS